MTQSDTTKLTAEEIQIIELRARALRSEAMSAMLRSGTARLVNAGRKFTSLFRHPRHA